MNDKTRSTSSVAIAAVLGAGALMVAEPAILGRGGALTTSAESRIGRPLTPLNYAGVARRTTRRAIYGGAVVGALVIVRPPGREALYPGSRCIWTTSYPVLLSRGCSASRPASGWRRLMAALAIA